MALSTASQADLYSLIAWLQSAMADQQERRPRNAEKTFQFRYSLATTEIDNADDRKRLLYFPAGFWIIDCACWVEDELDTGTNTLVWDLITETAAGVADTRKIITGAIAGRAAGEGVNMDAGGAVHVGERYLVFDPTTAANAAAAGDFVLTIKVAYGMAVAALPSSTFDAV